MASSFISDNQFKQSKEISRSLRLVPRSVMVSKIAHKHWRLTTLEEGGGGCVSKNVRRRRYGDESSGRKLSFLDDQLAYTVLHQQSFSRFLYMMNKGVLWPFPG